MGDDREQRDFLHAVLGNGRGEGAAELPVQHATRLQTTGLVEEARYLRWHAAAAGRVADENCVVIRQCFGSHSAGLSANGDACRPKTSD